MKLEQSAVRCAWTEAENRVPVTARAQLSALQATLSRIAPKDPAARESNSNEDLIVNDMLLCTVCIVLENAVLKLAGIQEIFIVAQAKRFLHFSSGLAQRSGI